MNVFPNDDPEAAAKKIFKDVFPENGNRKGKQKEKKVHFVQKHSEPGLLAEAVIAGGCSLFCRVKVRPQRNYSRAFDSDR